MRFRSCLWIGIGLSMIQIGRGFADSSAEIIFSPQGQVREVRQVRARFPEAMVPFGDIQGKESPFDIQCRSPGKARWADSKNWIYDFDRDVPADTECHFRLKPGLKALSGNEIPGKKEFAFSTGTPFIKRSYPYEGSTLEENQAFILTLNGEVLSEQIPELAYFLVDGILEKIPVQVILGEDRNKILKTVRSYHYGDLEHPTEGPHPEVVIVQAKRPFPNQAQVTLFWGKKGEQKLSFQVRSLFSVEFKCERENLESACVPVSPMRLNFSNTLSWAQAKKIQLVSPDGKKIQPRANPDIKDEEYTDSIRFQGPFLPKAEYRVVIPSDLKDESNRPLTNASSFPLKVQTDEMPPLAKFSGEFGILETQEKTLLPVTLRNLESSGKIQGRVLKFSGAPGAEILSRWLQNVSWQGNADNRGHSLLKDLSPSLGTLESLTIPKLNDAKDFEVVGIPLPGPGLYLTELESQILGKKLLGADRPMFVSTLALVTQLGVHFKKGIGSSLVWVTSLDQASPVSDAQVKIIDCSGKVVAEGKSDTQGRVSVGPLPEKTAECREDGVYSPYASGLFVTAQKRDDFTFLHTSWNRGIEPWRFGMYRGDSAWKNSVKSVLDRTLFRVGETVHMRNFIRHRTSEGFTRVPKVELPDGIKIQHSGSEESYEFPLNWDEENTSVFNWTIPEGAKLGNYLIYLTKKREKYSEHFQSGEFRVEEFRVPLMRGAIRSPSEPQISKNQFDIDVSVHYLVGGGASSLPVRVRAIQNKEWTPRFEDFDQFVLSNGPVKVGVQSDRSEDEPKSEFKLKKYSATLDHSGSARIQVTDLTPVGKLSSVLLELEFRDPNGEVQTSSATVPLFPTHRIVGIKSDSWSNTQDQVKLESAVLDLQGKPIPNVPVEVSFFEEKRYSHRKKVVGGFYAYEHRTEVKPAGIACRGVTDPKGVLKCQVASPVAGSVILQAKTQDENGKETYTHTSIYVHGSSDQWFSQGDHDRIDLLPDQKKYEVGETAKFQVQMPFREGTALVTVEREGILDSFVVPITSQNPVIEVPIQKTYSPNVYVSAFVIRGRVGDVQPTAVVDLGKPAYKLGNAEIKVDWKPHELKVKVTSDRDLYQVREKAQVQVKVTPAIGGALAPGSDVVIAAVDEGLLQLSPNPSWNLLEEMMARRSNDVETFTAQSEIIGKRHFGLKAVPVGGGGGFLPTRELFNTLLFWDAKVPLNSEGEATVTIPLNDSITSFRIVAIAHSGANQFGTGFTQIRSTQDLSIQSGIPPLIREGDQFPAEVTLRNSTATQKEVEVLGALKNSPLTLAPQSITLAPGESKTVSWNIQVPVGISSFTYEIDAKSEGKTVDRLRFQQKVVEAVPVRVVQSTLAQVDPSFQMAVERPAQAVPDKGGVRIHLTPTLLSGLDGVKDSMRNYPYSCFEQKVSRAIALKDEKLWKQLMKELPTYLDHDGLVKYFPSNWLNGSDTLTAYLLAISDEIGWEIPESIYKKMKYGLTQFVSGSIQRRSGLNTSDLNIRKIAAAEALSRDSDFSPELLTSIDISPEFWPTSAVIDWYNILNRVTVSADSDAKKTEAEQILRSRLNFQGTRVTFSTDKTDEMPWMMLSTDLNINRLILTILKSPSWAAKSEDLPRLVRGALGRQVQGHWLTTPANAWGSIAIEEFAHQFENTGVSGMTSIQFDQKESSLNWKQNPNGKVTEMPWGPTPQELKLSHRGSGKPWVTLQSRAAVPLQVPQSTGFKVEKRWTPVEQKKPGVWSKGDVVRVRVDLEAQAESTWVVLNDPIPAGATLLGSSLGNDSGLLSAQEKKSTSVWTAFEERGFEGFRAYYQYVPKGKWSVEYTLRLNQSGKMNLPPTRVEAMYAPEAFGEIPNAPVLILE